MTRGSVLEYAAAVRGRYLSAGKMEKGRIPASSCGQPATIARQRSEYGLSHQNDRLAWTRTMAASSSTDASIPVATQYGAGQAWSRPIPVSSVVRGRAPPYFWAASSVLMTDSSGIRRS